jgi:hypothetical protein
MSDDIGKTLHDELEKMGRLDQWTKVAAMCNAGQWDEAIKYVADLAAQTPKSRIPIMAIVVILAIALILVVQ